SLPGDGGDDTLGVDLSDDVVGAIGDEEFTGGADRHAVGTAEGRLGGGSTVPCEARRAGRPTAGDEPGELAGHGGDDAVPVDPADHVVERVGDVHVPRSVEREHSGFVHLGIGGGPA